MTSVVWSLRLQGDPNVLIRTHADGGFVISHVDGGEYGALRLSRRDLRLLARRIEQVLEDTA